MAAATATVSFSSLLLIIASVGHPTQAPGIGRELVYQRQNTMKLGHGFVALLAPCLMAHGVQATLGRLRPPNDDDPLDIFRKFFSEIECEVRPFLSLFYRITGVDNCICNERKLRRQIEAATDGKRRHLGICETTQIVVEEEIDITEKSFLLTCRIGPNRTCGITGGGANGLFVGAPEEAIFFRLTAYGGSSKDGGFLHQTGGKVSLWDMTIKNNKAMDNGGAIRMEGGLLQIDNSTFYNNTAGDNGGAISIVGNGNTFLYIEDDTEASYMISNTAGGNGGAISVEGQYNDRVLLDRVVFENNQADAGGGAMYLSKGLATLTQTLFSNNSADIGGALLLEGYKADLRSGTSFAGNAAREGGNDVQIMDDDDPWEYGTLAQCVSSETLVTFCDGIADGISEVTNKMRKQSFNNTNCYTESNDGPPRERNTFCPNSAAGTSHDDDDDDDEVIISPSRSPTKKNEEEEDTNQIPGQQAGKEDEKHESRPPKKESEKKPKPPKMDKPGHDKVDSGSSAEEEAEDSHSHPHKKDSEKKKKPPKPKPSDRPSSSDNKEGKDKGRPGEATGVQTQQSKEESKVSPGGIFGIVFAALVLLALIALILCCRRRNLGRLSQKKQPEDAEHEGTEKAISEGPDGVDDYELDDTSLPTSYHDQHSTCNAASSLSTDTKSSKQKSAMAGLKSLGVRRINQDVHKCNSATCTSCYPRKLPQKAALTW